MKDAFNKIPKVLVFLILTATVLWNLKPEHLSTQGWHLFIIFISTIMTIIFSSMPIGAISMLTLASTVITGTLNTKEALSGFNSKISWMVLLALFVSDTISKSGLGKRIAYYFLCKSRNSLVSISYTLIICEFMLSPAIPSIVARGSGIMYPIVSSVIDVLLQKPRKKNNIIKSYLIQVCFHSAVITSAISLTAMAANPLIVSIANTFGINITWSDWFIGSIVPGVITLIMMPLFLFYLLKPDMIDTTEVKIFAKKQLQLSEKLSINEILIIITLAGLVGFWVLGDFLGINATDTILVGFSILLVTGVISWDDVISDKESWGIFIWFSVLLMLSGFLVRFGTIDWINYHINLIINNADPVVIIPITLITFFYLHYFFVSTTAYVSTLLTPFLIILTNAQVPPKIAVMTLASSAIISGGLTHYTIGTAPGYYLVSGMKTKEWCKAGMLVSTANILTWFITSSVWWKVIGWY